jgi:hypothetical protein
MFSFDCEIDNLSPYYHDEYEMFKYVHEVVLAARVVYWQTYLSQVLVLPHEITFVCDIPAHRVCQSY